MALVKWMFSLSKQGVQPSIVIIIAAIVNGIKFQLLLGFEATCAGIEIGPFICNDLVV